MSSSDAVHGLAWYEKRSSPAEQDLTCLVRPPRRVNDASALIIDCRRHRSGPCGQAQLILESLSVVSIVCCCRCSCCSISLHSRLVRVHAKQCACEWATTDHRIPRRHHQGKLPPCWRSRTGHDRQMQTPLHPVPSRWLKQHQESSASCSCCI